MTDREALMKAILTDPADDTARLVYADWLQEHGEDARAEFIRVQCRLARKQCPWCEGKGTLLGGAGDKSNPECDCGTAALRRRERDLFTFYNIQTWFRDPGPVFDRHTTDVVEYKSLRETCWVMGVSACFVSRGFISGVTLDSRTFLGGPCGFCSGRGNFQTSGSYAECPRCIGPRGVGTGRTPGVARDLFARHPITAVTLTDLSPWERVAYPGRLYSWTRADGTDPHVRPTGAVPAVLFGRMWEDNPGARVWGEDPPDVMLEWTDPDSPARALSAAAVAVGRKLAEEANSASAIPTDPTGG